MRPKLSFANVMSVIAVFIALGGTVYAAQKISGKTIRKGSVPGNRLKKDSVTGKQVKETSLGEVPLASIANGISAPEAYREVGTSGNPPFQNGAANNPNFSTAAFFKDHEGVVHLKGAVDVPANNLVLFTLPVGYRPAQMTIVPTSAGPQQAFIYIFPNGNIQGGTTNGSASSPYYLDSITFLAQG